MANFEPPDLPSTADRPAIRTVRQRRLLGVRLWLALMFAAIGILSGTSVYLFVSESSDQAAADRAIELTEGRTARLQNSVESALRQIVVVDPSHRQIRKRVGPVLADVRSHSFRAWYFDIDRHLITRAVFEGVDVADVPRGREAIRRAFSGQFFTNSDLPENRIVTATPVFAGGLSGALLVFAERPPEVTEALQALQSQRLTALAVAVIVAALIGLLVASLITSRVKRLAAAADRIAQGNLEAPLDARGGDEIGDLGRVLDSMRVALAESFEALSSERDRLSAIFASLEDAVIVVGSEGDVRFANPAASSVIEPDGRPIGPLRPWIRRATQRGSIEHDNVRIEDRVFGLSARNLPAEGAVLLVARDRTEELRRDQAEREFVSNAAHELRNPIAGMSGAIEVLRSGAKDDPEARDHFLGRLADDIDRTSRLTKALLTLARMEAIGESEADVVSVELAVRESVEAIEVPEGIELELDVKPELTAAADPVLLRQVLIGLLTNAFKHTPPPGAVTLRAQRGGDEQILIEIEDTGTGIPEAERDRVFERFYRGSGSLEREGFGLGLAIAKRMIDVMGGEISVSSREGEGSTFTIRLPQAAPTASPVV